MNKRLRELCLIGCVTLLILIGIEGGARLFEYFYPPEPVDLGLGFDAATRLFIPDPSDPAYLTTNPGKQAAFLQQRFPAAKPRGTFRLFMIGGSSVNYLGPELLNLNSLLADALADTWAAVETINAGGLSYGSQRLALVMAEILRYEPDCILLYSGHNEFEEMDQFHYVRLESLPLQRFLGHSALFRLLSAQKGAWQIRREQRSHARLLLEHPEVDYVKVFQYPFSPEEIAARMASYETNLRLMIDLCQRQGVALIIGSTPSNLWKPLLLPSLSEESQRIKALYAAKRYTEGKALALACLAKSARHQASGVENAIIRRLASEKRIPLADVEQAIIDAEPNGVPGERLFTDECHLNGEGSALLIESFFRKILTLF